MRETDPERVVGLQKEIYRKKREVLAFRRRSGAASPLRVCVVREGVSRRGVGLARALWPRAVVDLEVGFVGGDAEQRRLVAEVASEWNRWSGLQLRFVEGAVGPVRVGFDPAQGSWSYVGTDALLVQAGPTVNLGWVRAGMEETEARRVILHEFGHVLGLVHEHQSPAGGVPWDLAAVYRFYAGPPHYWSAAKVEANVLAVYDRDRIRGTEFDKDSIMLYPIPGELTGGKLRVGWNGELSEQDKAFVAMVYGSVDGG